MVQAVVKAFEMLSPEEQRHVGIFASRFGETGSINFLGREYGLPRAVGSNNNYWIWGPNGYTGELMLILAREDSELLDQFASAERVADIKCKYCLPGLKKNRFIFAVDSADHSRKSGRTSRTSDDQPRGRRQPT